MSNEKRLHMRKQIWQRLAEVAYPDSRFHFDFSQFIPDFEGSAVAVENLLADLAWKDAETIFIAPDNCLEELRYQAIRQGKKLIVSTYGIRRGFVYLTNENINPHNYELAATLDGMEKVGSIYGIEDLKDKVMKIDLMITGGSVISSINGIRFGKGHGFFDLEWGIFYTVKLVCSSTPVFAVAHDCQVIDSSLEPSVVDSACDKIFTPKQVIEIKNPQKPKCGIMWERLESGMLGDIPVLSELKFIFSDSLY